MPVLTEAHPPLPATESNGRARRMLVESAWSYRFAARQTMLLKRKAVNASVTAKKIAWKAQVRMCGRYRTLTRAGNQAGVRGHRPRVGRLHLGQHWPETAGQSPPLAALPRQTGIKA